MLAERTTLSIASSLPMSYAPNPSPMSALRLIRVPIIRPSSRVGWTGAVREAPECALLSRRHAGTQALRCYDTIYRITIRSAAPALALPLRSRRSYPADDGTVSSLRRYGGDGRIRRAHRSHRQRRGAAAQCARARSKPARRYRDGSEVSLAYG